MKTKLLVITLFLLPIYGLNAQDKTPKLSGKVNISIKDGTFECDLTLSNIPRIRDYFIRLNSGMNLLHMQSKKPNDFIIYYDKSNQDTNSTGESSAYYFPDNTGKGKFLPQSVRFRYVGKYPVATDTIENYSRQDWKGNIAFNGKTVRTDGRQAAWYPVLYDITKDKIYNLVTYDIELHCVDCDQLYVNGNVPFKGPRHNFKSEVPQELALFCGNYDVANIGNTYVLNSGMKADELKQFSTLINSYKKFYSDNLKIPFGAPVTFVQTTPTSKYNSWFFVTYPTIMSIGWNNRLERFYLPKYKNSYRPFIAHELGHYYFGTYKVFNSALGDMMSEGFAEYLSLCLTYERIGKDAYKNQIEKKIENLKDFNVKPIGKIEASSDYISRDLFVYNYAPIIFTALEKEIGKAKMWTWLNNILNTPTKYTNYDFLIATLKKTLHNDEKFSRLKNLYFENDHALKNAIGKIEEE